jgi:hypothetical protein
MNKLEASSQSIGRMEDDDDSQLKDSTPMIWRGELEGGGQASYSELASPRPEGSIFNKDMRFADNLSHGQAARWVRSRACQWALLARFASTTRQTNFPADSCERQLHRATRAAAREPILWTRWRALVQLAGPRPALSRRRSRRLTSMNTLPVCPRPERGKQVR